ncbi:MAG: right-handed parallel beta-helix repeat-containing protein [Verrucomicrobia bacterium]|nr:right-handed parallel beta-helix repeat-containing protein [Verrucomicrobiota bacterium]
MNDSFAGSLRQAISDARSGDAIVFAPGLTGTIKLTSGQLVINKDLKIIGPGAKVVTADAQGLSGVFQIDDRSVVTLVGLTIMGGKAAAGGGIVVFGTLTMRDCVLRNNTAAGYGGGIVTDRGATCVIQDCTISDNSAGNYGGGTAFGPGQVSLENCTLAGNRAGIGGGIYAYNCKLKVLSTTVCGNSASSDAAIWLQGSLTAVQVSNSIIAGNAGVAGVGECFGSFLSLGYNLIGTAGLSTGWGATGDQVGTVANPLDPKLGPLQDNGGPTPTMAPLPGSKAIDQGRRNGLSTDQRGRPRPKNFPSIPDANYGDGSDIGAVEVQ